MAEYPAHLARERRTADGRTVLIRPIRADDEAAEREFLTHLSDETRRLRFQRSAGAVSDVLLHFYTHIDYDRHMAFVCEARSAQGAALVGEARYVARPGGRSAEFSIVVADAWRHTGIAEMLLDALIRAARSRGFETLEGLVLRENADMLHFVEAHDFDAFDAAEDPASVRVVKKL